jgi:RND family efflux transporter MFP subunit
MKQNLMEYEDLPDKEDLAREIEPDVDRVPEHAPRGRPPAGLGARARLLGFGAFLLLAGALAYGGWNYLAHYRAVMATAQQSRDFVPSVQVGEVRMNDSKLSVTLPGTTAAFSAANIYARASGYIEKRAVDIGDHVKAGQLLAQITAPELDHQISQAEATLGQSQATLLQTQANTELARVTNDRNIPLVKQGWVTTQQGDTTRLTLQAQEAAIGVAQANIAAWQAQLQVLRQQKAYQRVVAPFDGIVTQRNVDVGDLLQADAASGTFMFSVMQSDVLRIYVYVPQDAAFGLSPGVEAVVRDRRPQSGRGSVPGNLLHGGTADPAKDTDGARERVRDHFQSGRPAGRRRERRRRTDPKDIGCARSRDGRGSARRPQGRRAGDPQPDGQSRRRQQGGAARASRSDPAHGRRRRVKPQSAQDPTICGNRGKAPF